MQRPLALIVDPNPTVRDELSRLAAKVGLRSMLAGDDVEALSLLSAEPADIVVIDGVASRAAATSLIERVRKVRGMGGVPVMVVTTDTRPATRAGLLDDGADDVVTRPVDSRELRARLRALSRHSDVNSALDQATRERDDATRELEHRNRELERLMLGLVVALERANTLNDIDTSNHIRRVGEFAATLGRSYGLDDDAVLELHRYAGLHDVGKIGLRDAILKKPGKLTPAEFDEMKQHTLIGGELLRSAGLPDVAWQIAQHHHERWDGTGYPHRLAGDYIPLAARIVAVADVFDALMSERPYKRAFTFEESRAEMLRVSGSHLDPRLVWEFFEHESVILQIRKMFSDGEEPREEWSE